MSAHSPRPINSALLPTHYRGSLALFAEEQLRRIGASLRHGTRTTEGWRDGHLIHRCEDIQSGRWVEVAPGAAHSSHVFVSEGRNV